MPFIDLPRIKLRQYYVINATYADDNLDMDLSKPPPPSRDSLDPTKPILLLQHAGTSCTNSFIYQFRDSRLSSALNLVAFDGRYLGRSAPAGDDARFQTLEERADELLEAVDAIIGDRPFSYLGESFAGAHCGAYVAAKRPNQVKAMILISPSFITDQGDMVDILTTDWLPICDSNKGGKGDGSGRLPDEALEVVRDYFFSGQTLHPERQQAFLNQYQFQHGPGRSIFMLQQLLRWFRRDAPPPEVFQAVRCPVLLLGGSRDTAVNPADALGQWYNAFVSVEEADKRIERIVDGSHFLATMEPGRVNRLVLAFLKRYNLA
ncbi:hypothetical protein JCM6882_001023 [Rhodosporidiobolus microsporus]